LFVLGEANFSDHGANRLGASALMQGLADGYFVLPYTIGHYFATSNRPSLRLAMPNSRMRKRLSKRLRIGCCPSKERERNVAASRIGENCCGEMRLTA